MNLKFSYHVTAAKKIVKAEEILSSMDGQQPEIVQEFLKTINDILGELLEEYSIKFGCKLDHFSFEKFKTRAKKTDNLKAIKFLIWYEKQYKNLRQSPAGQLLEKNHQAPYSLETYRDLLNRVREIAYSAYENF